MAQPAERPSSKRAGLTNLQKRILSAAVLLPVTIAAIYFGRPYFTLLIGLFSGLAAWEWTRVAATVRPDSGTIPVPNPPKGLWSSIAMLSGITVAACVGYINVLPSPKYLLEFVFIGILWLGVTCLSLNWRRIVWTVPGTIYVAVAAAALVALRNDPDSGRAALVWIIGLVVAADTGGYLVGRTIGGPKLAPRISPNKTWSGLGGAVAGAALVGFLTAFVLNHTDVWMLTLISAGLGLVEQAGDLVESAFKRHFGVKDTSQIIPGHGGVLDRVDGLLAVAVAVLALSIWAGGSVLAW